MDDYDLVVLDDERNAAMRRPVAMARTPAARAWPPPRPAAPAMMFRPPPPRPMVIVQRPPSLFAGLDLSALLEHGVSILAALQELPEAPTISGDPSKDVANMILYQEALGAHAKADERVRAFGSLAAQVLSVVLKNAQRTNVGVPMGG